MGPKQLKNKEFWVTNISQSKDISLSDLRMTLRRGKSYNLLDKRHFKYSEEQLQKSMEKGSIFKKRNVIKVRQVSPIKVNNIIDIVDTREILKPARNAVKIEVKHYEELDFDNVRAEEEAFAEADSEAAMQDTAPILAVDNKFKKFDDE